jgi:hypothetical protein
MMTFVLWEHDPLNPRKWSLTKKNGVSFDQVIKTTDLPILCQVAVCTFVASLGSSIMAPGLLDVAPSRGHKL